MTRRAGKRRVAPTQFSGERTAGRTNSGSRPAAARRARPLAVIFRMRWFARSATNRVPAARKCLGSVPEASRKCLGKRGALLPDERVRERGGAGSASESTGGAKVVEPVLLLREHLVGRRELPVLARLPEGTCAAPRASHAQGSSQRLRLALSLSPCLTFALYVVLSVCLSVCRKGRRGPP